MSVPCAWPSMETKPDWPGGRTLTAFSTRPAGSGAAPLAPSGSELPQPESAADAAAAAAKSAERDSKTISPGGLLTGPTLTGAQDTQWRMNFLAHLWLADHSNTSLAGAILGDRLRGRIPATLRAELALAIGLHRRVDAVTDRHPVTRAARARFAAGERRYAGIVLDIVCDHLLARRWSAFSAIPLEDFARRAAAEVAHDAAWSRDVEALAPDAEDLRRLLLSYALEEGIDRALQRTARRLSRPQGLLDAARNWRDHALALQPGFAELLDDLRDAAQVFVRSRSA